MSIWHKQETVALISFQQYFAAPRQSMRRVYETNTGGVKFFEKWGLYLLS
jgi:hypothetical protein